MAAEKLGSKGQAWFCTTGLPSDVVIEVGEMSFHLHKFPLMSKSRKLHQLITEREQSPRPRGDNASGVDPEKEHQSEEEIEEEEPPHISLPNFPGGSETFEAAAKFCYGVKVELTSWNAAPLRCAAEYLEMTEAFAEDNLIARTERFLAQSVLRNLGESVKALKSCEEVMPLAEDLGLLQRCIDSLAARACSADTSSLFGWPIREGSGGGGGVSGSDRQPSNPVLWNGIDTGVLGRRNGARSSSAAESWFEDLTMLSLPVYKRLISAMKERDLGSEAIEGSLVSYAKRSIPGLSRSSRKHSSAPVASEAEQRELLETVITNLPLDKTSGLMTTRFLFGLLRTANILRASEPSRAVLERKIASQLEQATLDDLLMPSYSYLVETLYDVDCVERIIAYFLQGLGLDEGSPMATAAAVEEEEEEERAEAHRLPRADRLMLVGKLVDGYLAEIASDANLRPEKFGDLALVLPGHARLYDDGLYRAVDVYLKAHPGLTEDERERVCAVMDCQKLTLEACTHAAQNERLPLRAVVQVLFFEQLQLRHAIAGTLLGADGATAGPQLAGLERTDEGEHGGAREGGVTWRTAIRENQVLRLDMDSMRSRVHELERECSSMKKAIAKIDHGGGGALVDGEGGAAAGSGWRSSITRRFGCKFKTQVCDSHERAVVESRRSRAEDSP